MSMVILLGLTAPQAFAGNKDRSGQAGASQLLVNPWAASSGWGNAGMSKVHGVDAMFGNVAGIIKAREARIVALERQLAAANKSDIEHYPFAIGAADERTNP